MKYPDDFINKIICGDCLEVLKDIPDQSIDLTITDPPYGILKSQEWDGKMHYLTTIEKWMKEIKRVSIFGAIVFTSDKYLSELLLQDKYHRLLVWDKKTGCGSANNHIWYSSEYIAVFRYSEKAEQRGDKKLWRNNTISLVKKENFDTGHPTIKPIELMECLLRHYSNPDDLILDPFAGSGTTLMAAKKWHRRYIGIEIDKDYCNLAARRIRHCNGLF